MLSVCPYAGVRSNVTPFFCLWQEHRDIKHEAMNSFMLSGSVRNVALHVTPSFFFLFLFLLLKHGDLVGV